MLTKRLLAAGPCDHCLLIFSSTEHLGVKLGNDAKILEGVEIGLVISKKRGFWSAKFVMGAFGLVAGVTRLVPKVPDSQRGSIM